MLDERGRVLCVVSLEGDEKRKVKAPREFVCTVCPNSAKLTAGGEQGELGADFRDASGVSLLAVTCGSVT
jgi:hypothetical protein